MGNLSYRTRGNSSPQGKERVYFTCHPADFQAFFDPICADIFKTQNCAIWYREDLERADSNGKSDGRNIGEACAGMEADEDVRFDDVWGMDAEKNNREDSDAEEKTGNTAWSDEFSLDLGHMQLFVIPITSRFLFRPNRARDMEFPFALEHHIPILPLMQEPGLEREFNRICGDLQFLDRHGSKDDPTAIPYEEKLKKFLESVYRGKGVLREMCGNPQIDRENDRNPGEPL